MRKFFFIALCFWLTACFAGCGRGKAGDADHPGVSGGLVLEAEGAEMGKAEMERGKSGDTPYTVNTKISQVINDPVFEERAGFCFR